MVLSVACGTARAESVALADTLTVTADSEELAGVIAAVGRRMREADQRAAPYAYTTVTTRTDSYGPADSTGVTIVTRTWTRQIRDRDQSVRTVTLAVETRRYEGGKLVWTSNGDRPGSARWREPARPLLEALPFAPGAADKYRYEVREHRLVGNTLIYRIAFRPRNRFDPLPTGEVWVDYAGWVMRRLTARMARGSTPTALLDEVPLYRLVQEQREGLWLPVDVHLVMNLKPAPFLTLPRRMDLRVRIKDVEVRGRPDPRHSRLTADERNPDEFWLTPEAAADSLAAFWAQVDEPWAATDSLADSWEDFPGPESLSAVREDSLTAWADEQLAAMTRRGRPYRLRIAPSWPRFNRVQGPVPMVKLDLTRAGNAHATVGMRAGLGTADGRFQGGLSWEPVDPSAGWGCWLKGRWETTSFGAPSVRPLHDVAAALYGHDPRHYYEQRSVQAGVRWALTPHWLLSGAVTAFRQRSLEVGTTWNLWGEGHSPAENLTADEVAGRRLNLNLSWRSAGWAIRTGVTRLAGLSSKGPLGWNMAVSWQGLDGLGNAWRVQVHGLRWDRSAPLQDQMWLGDAGTLSGWSAGRLRGNEGIRGSVTVEGAGDLLRALRIPVLGGWRLQPVGLVEAGWTGNAGLWRVRPDADADLAGTGGPLGSLGFGLQRRLGLPILGERQKLRLMASLPVGPGAQAAGPRFTLCLTKGAGEP